MFGRRQQPRVSLSDFDVDDDELAQHVHAAPGGDESEDDEPARRPAPRARPRMSAIVGVSSHAASAEHNQAMAERIRNALARNSGGSGGSDDAQQVPNRPKAASAPPPLLSAQSMNVPAPTLQRAGPRALPDAVAAPRQRANTDGRPKPPPPPGPSPRDRMLARAASMSALPDDSKPPPPPPPPGPSPRDVRLARAASMSAIPEEDSAAPAPQPPQPPPPPQPAAAPLPVVQEEEQQPDEPAPSLVIPRPPVVRTVSTEPHVLTPRRAERRWVQVGSPTKSPFSAALRHSATSPPPPSPSPPPEAPATPATPAMTMTPPTPRRPAGAREVQTQTSVATASVAVQTEADDLGAAVEANEAQLRAQGAEGVLEVFDKMRIEKERIATVVARLGRQEEDWHARVASEQASMVAQRQELAAHKAELEEFHVRRMRELLEMAGQLRQREAAAEERMRAAQEGADRVTWLEAQVELLRDELHRVTDRVPVSSVYDEYSLSEAEDGGYFGGGGMVHGYEDEQEDDDDDDDDDDDQDGGWDGQLQMSGQPQQRPPALRELVAPSRTFVGSGSPRSPPPAPRAPSPRPAAAGSSSPRPQALSQLLAPARTFVGSRAPGSPPADLGLKPSMTVGLYSGGQRARRADPGPQNPHEARLAAARRQRATTQQYGEAAHARFKALAAEEEDGELF